MGFIQIYPSNRALNATQPCPTLAGMSRTKNAGTGDGYLGAVMVHRISRVIGTVESVVAGRDGWPPELTLKLPDGSHRKGKLGDFREPTATERKTVPVETKE